MGTPTHGDAAPHPEHPRLCKPAVRCVRPPARPSFTPPHPTPCLSFPTRFGHKPTMGSHSSAVPFSPRCAPPQHPPALHCPPIGTPHGGPTPCPVPPTPCPPRPPPHGGSQLCVSYETALFSHQKPPLILSQLKGFFFQRTFGSVFFLLSVSIAKGKKRSSSHCFGFQSLLPGAVAPAVPIAIEGHWDHREALGP